MDVAPLDKTLTPAMLSHHLRRHISTLVLIAGVIVVVKLSGAGVSEILAGTAVASVLSGSLLGSLGQLLSGYVQGRIIAAEGFVRDGERIAAAGVIGVVIDRQPRVTVIRQADGTVTQIANALLFAGPVSKTPTSPLDAEPRPCLTVTSVSR